MKRINSAIEELKSLQISDGISMAKINWWLLKHDKLYSYCKENWNNASCFEELPCFHTLNSVENKFLDFYKSLEEVAEMHKKETYFQDQLELLKKVESDSPALMQWLKKNEKLGTEDFFTFWSEWLQEHNSIEPFLPQFEDVKVKLDPKEFEFTVRFLEEFDRLYWTSDICSELP
ncbi:hypothetical protein [Christiangramia sp.]|uniref:hypothetical protein n=1 Tax=Christiangramia sp. TaxID=1931228 RepID=UPI00261429C3|nr:hypothetical protein [Christiangramia sp.]